MTDGWQLALVIAVEVLALAFLVWKVSGRRRRTRRRGPDVRASALVRKRRKR